MALKTGSDKQQLFEKLLNEARAETEKLRERLEQYERIIASTRLVMGHELKKPATAISGYLDLVCEDLEKANDLGTLTYALKARAECELLNELNEFYVELLRVDSDPDMVGLQTIEIEPLIREIVDEFPSAQNARARVEVRVDASVRPVSVNRKALRLIVMNLIENALLYSQVKTPIRVEVEETKDRRGMAGGRLLKIRVKDDGVGIPESYLKRIFSPFVRLREDMAEGSGLGLSLVRSLVDLAGGDVYISSGSDEGTVVHVTIPVRQHDGRDEIVRR